MEADSMKMLIAYDVSTVDSAGQRRLRRVAQACEDFGQRVQKSLFECSVGPAEWVQLRGRLLVEINQEQDSLRFYFLSADVRLEHHGVDKTIDLDGPLVVYLGDRGPRVLTKCAAGSRTVEVLSSQGIRWWFMAGNGWFKPAFEGGSRSNPPKPLPFHHLHGGRFPLAFGPGAD
jgi:CRISPR-associated protein Cas2